MKKKGFTLVELLATLVILSIIALITVPVILNVIESSRKKAAENSFKGYMDAAEKFIAEEDFEDGSSLPEADEEGCYSLVELDKLINIKGVHPTIGGERIICFKDGELTYLHSVIINGYEIWYDGDIHIDKIGGGDRPDNPGDKEAPSNDMPNVLTTTNSIVVTNRQTPYTNASNVDTSKYSIKKVEYSIKKSSDTTWGKWQQSERFTGLKSNISYDVRTRTTNNYNLSTISRKRTVKTSDMETPEYAVNPDTEWASKRTVTITYPTGEGFVYSYSTDGGNTWKTVTENTTDVPFTSQGTLIAKVADGESANANIKKTSSITIGNIDTTEPDDAKPSGTSTTKSITVASRQKDDESGIKKVEYSIYKDNKWSSWQTGDTFGKLKNDTTYQVKTRSTNKAGISSESQVQNVTTADIPLPTYDTTGDTSKKTVTITYYGSFTNSYSIDGGQTWVAVTGNTATKTFTEDGTIIARSTDGENIKAADSLTVSGFVKGTGIPSKGYTAGTEITYAGLKWLVIKDNGDTTTLILKNNYTTGAFGNSAKFESGNNAYTQVNTNFVNAHDVVKKDIEGGMIILDGLTNSYVRLPKQSELSSNIPNGSSTNFWTLTSSGNNLYYGLPDGRNQYQAYSLESSSGPYYAGAGASTSSLSTLYTYSIAQQSSVTDPTARFDSTSATYYVGSGGTTDYGYYSTSYGTHTPSDTGSGSGIFAESGAVSLTEFLGNSGGVGCSYRLTSQNTCIGECSSTQTKSITWTHSPSSSAGRVKYCNGNSTSQYAYTSSNLPSKSGLTCTAQYDFYLKVSEDSATSSGYPPKYSCFSGYFSQPASYFPAERPSRFFSDCTHTITGTSIYYASPSGCSSRTGYSINTYTANMGFRPVITIKEK